MAGFNERKVLGIFLLAACAAWASEMMPLAECREKAASGDAEAQYQMGKRYEEGHGVTKNGVRAVVQYKKAAEQNHLKACVRLSELYSRGEYLKKDLALAAKYRALANGTAGELVAAKVDEVQKEQRVDEIEVALDYILGRNGKQKDSKAGIRILYSAAKERPMAKVVFVKRWENGDLDSALEVLADDEWNLIESWFAEAFAAGRKKSGLILGNMEYRNRRYELAAKYYLAAGKSGVPKAWYYLGCLYWTGSNTNRWNTPKYIQSDPKACDAFEQAVKLDPHYSSAKWNLGLLRLFSDDKRCVDFKKALTIFADFYAQEAASNNIDKWTLYDYGLSGWLVVGDAILRNREEIESVEQSAPNRGRIDYDFVMKKLRKRIELLEGEYGSLIKKRRHYLECIDKAANMGCEPAQKFIEKRSSLRN